MIPLFMDCTGRRIVIFGGGAVAARKAAYFGGGANVTVVSRSFVQKLLDLPVKRKVLDTREVPDEKIASLIQGAFLVIGALSDPAQNNRIGRLCRKEKIFFNNADGETGTVVLPAKTSGENYVLAISTKGGSPAVARFLREHLEQELPGLDAMILLQRRLRQELKEREPDQERRNAILRKVLADKKIWSAVGKDPDDAWEKVAARYLHG